MYRRPGTLAKVSNSLFTKLAALGIGPAKMASIEVAGRKSGVVRSTAVNLVKIDGTRYLVAPRGNTEWARNVRAAGGKAAIKRGKRTLVQLEELPVDQRAPIIQAYLKENAWVTQREFGVSPKAPIEEFHRIAPDHPVFRIEELA
jgi:deazaflavin-dependent oxidoreductase (nitroreductase family)